MVCIKMAQRMDVTDASSANDQASIQQVISIVCLGMAGSGKTTVYASK